MRRTFAVAMLCAIYLGALAGHIGFDLYERSYYSRGRVYRVWLERSAGREPHRRTLKLRGGADVPYTKTN